MLFYKTTTNTNGIYTFPSVTPGAIVLGIVLVTVVRLTHAHYAGAEGGKTASHASANNAAGPLDA